MRIRFLILMFAVVAAALASPFPIAAQTTQPSGEKAHAAPLPADLSGVWRRSRRPPDTARKYTIYELAFSITNELPPMTPWAEEKYKANKPNVGPRSVSLAETNDPIMQCAPPGVPRVYLIRGAPLEIANIPGRVLMIFEYDHFVRKIFTDGREHPADLSPRGWEMRLASGTATRWSWTPSVSMTKRGWIMTDIRTARICASSSVIRRIDHDTLTIDTTIEDPRAYTKPWGGHAIYELKTGWDLGEVVCEDNITYGDMQQKSEGTK